MKKRFLKAGISFLVCTVLFVGASYAYLSGKTEETETPAEKVKNDEPYFSATPVNCGVMLCLPDDSGLLFYLDFLKEKITVLGIDNTAETESEFKGYSIDKKIFADYNFLSLLIDRIGGIELEENGEAVRLTGMQVTEKLSEKNDRILNYQIIRAVLGAVSENGLTRNDFVFLIENCDNTDLTLPDCYNWERYIKQMSRNINILT
ncbi:MAG: hypothetical protein MJ090_03015 [Clostridia bacterium]|nr:hypothetical protein [Clostridia bacterium]